MSKNLIITTIILILLIAGFIYFVATNSDLEPQLPNEEEAVDDGNENEPEEDYQVFYIPEEAEDMIDIESPRPGNTISSPLTIEGEARGSWFFEATAPVVLTDWDGLIIAEGFIEAEGEWMTEEFVPFSGTLEFTKPAGDNNRGNLIIQNANASGLPEGQRAAEMVIFFE